MSSPMDIVANAETGNRNLTQQIKDKNYDPTTGKGTPGQGYMQIIDPTWRQYAPAAGVDINQYPSANAAPRNIQMQVAGAIPINQWGPNTVAALKAKYPNIDTSQPLGAVQSAAIGAPAGALAQGAAGVLPGFSDKATSDAFQKSMTDVGKAMGWDQGGGGEDQTPKFQLQPGQAPGVRNMSPLLAQGAAPQIYGHTLTSMADPTRWGAAPPGAAPYAQAGPQTPPGTSLTSLDQMQQMALSPYALGQNPWAMWQDQSYG
jgi:hypothetical protein